MSFGNIIKKLRLDKNMTQEQLAEVLSISAQAVSRWETNLALPDISLLPALANFFEVTTDYLLEVDSSKKERDIEQCLENAREYTRKGYWSKGVEILREAMKKYPSAYELQVELANALFGLPQELGYVSEEAAENLWCEIVSLNENVLKNSTSTELRNWAVQLLCYVYPRLQMRDKAETLAKTMPHMYQCQEALLGAVADGKKRFQYMQDAMFGYLDNLLVGMMYNNAPLEDGTRPYTAKEMIALYKQSIAILDIIFEDKNYGFFGERIAWIYLEIAKCCAELKESEEMMIYLRLSMERAIRNDKISYNSDAKYTCLVFRDKKYGTVSYNITENDAAYIMNSLKEPVFDFIRDEPEFQELIKEIEKYAGRR